MQFGDFPIFDGEPIHPLNGNGVAGGGNALEYARIFAGQCPTHGDDLFFGSDDGKLYNIDVDSGALIWEFATGGRIRGTPALADGRVIVASGDGNVYAISADSGLQLWKSPIAHFSRASPAIKDSTIYIGDEAGNVYALDAATGRPKWQKQLKGYVSQCPVITQDGVFFASEQGDTALISPDGNIKWKRALGLRLTGQAIATETQLLLPTERGLSVLKRSDGEDDTRFKAPGNPGKVTGVLVYKNRICLTTANASTNFSVPPRTYANYVGGPAVWSPKPAAEASK